MKAIAIIGVLLIVAGIVSLAYGGFTYKEKQTVVQVGPLEVTAEERKKFPISPLAGGVMVAGGVILLATGLSRR